MTRFRQTNGDDYPAAAAKHLADAQALWQAGRYDGAGYHAGYVIECALKTLLQADHTIEKSHNLSALSARVAALATGGSPLIARYCPRPAPALRYAPPPAGWHETMRYRAAGDLDQNQSRQWVAEAERVYNQSVLAMRKDGVIW